MTAVLGLVAWAAISGDPATLARWPWPITTPEEDEAIAEHAGELDGATLRAWALDRLLPMLAGVWPVRDEVLRGALAQVPNVPGDAVAMAALEDARETYARGDPARALALYDAVPRGTSIWAEAVGERAWALARLGRDAEALGAAVSLEAPWFPVREQAEAALLRASRLVAICRFEEARLLVAPWASAGSDSVPVGAWKSLNSLPDPVAEAARVSPLVSRVRRGLVLAETVRPDRVAALQTLGEALFDQALRTERTLARERRRRALEVTYEAIRGERRLREAGRAPEALRPPALAPIGDDEIPWTFDGTFWRDELGTYRFAAADACPKAGP